MGKCCTRYCGDDHCDCEFAARYAYHPKVIAAREERIRNSFPYSWGKTLDQETDRS